MLQGSRYGIHANLSLAHHVLQFLVGLARHVLEFLQWVESCIDELQQVLTRHLSGSTDLSEHKCQGVELL